MDSTTDQPTSAPSSRTTSRLAKTFQKVIHLKKPTKTLSKNGFCLLIPQDKCRNGGFKHDHSSQRTFDKHLVDEVESRNKAAMEAFVSKLFATISAAKAAYAELQLAQFPYNGEAIQSSDQAVVDQLKALSEFKYSFLKKQIDNSPPHVTFLLSEIQEQQSVMKMYEITMNKLRREIEAKETQVSSLEKELFEADSINKSIENKLKSSGCFPVLNNVSLSDLVPKDFIAVLHYALRSVRNLVKLLIHQMESANWDIDSAVKAIEAHAVFPKSSYKYFAFESFVCREMFEGFNDPNFSVTDEQLDHKRGVFYFNHFNKLKSANATQVLKQNPRSTFGKFTRAKFLRLVHPKMEASFFGNLNQRKKINVWEFPETQFFTAFAEMAKRVWILQRLAFSFENEVSVFQVRKECRFSEVYMESVNGDVLSSGGDLRVAFMVVPGFKIGKTVVQSQVYLSPARRRIIDKLCL